MKVKVKFLTPVLPHEIPGNDAAGEIVVIGDKVKTLVLGDRVAPITDTENITGRELTRSWLVADEDGVLADYLVFNETKFFKLLGYLYWLYANIIPCAGVTAWAALKGTRIGQTVLIQGELTMAKDSVAYSRFPSTGGVRMFALKLARLTSLKVIFNLF